LLYYIYPKTGSDAPQRCIINLPEERRRFWTSQNDTITRFGSGFFNENLTSILSCQERKKIRKGFTR